jgi:hypothetical protein
MQNIAMVSPLFYHLFKAFNRQQDIKASLLYNCVDSTLIEEKNAEFINQYDWDKARVTTRSRQSSVWDEVSQTHVKKSVKYRVCGSKGLIFINRRKQIIHAERSLINDSDYNVLKNTALYKPYLKGFILADRGFTSKEVRSRLKSYRADIFNRNHVNCEILSPFKKSENKHLDKKNNGNCIRKDGR